MVLRRKRSRIISKDQRSPNKSNAVLMGQPDLLFVISIKNLVMVQYSLLDTNIRSKPLFMMFKLKKKPNGLQVESLYFDFRTSFQLLLKS